VLRHEILPMRRAPSPVGSGAGTGDSGGVATLSARTPA
jgi:hypothetical protein